MKHFLHILLLVFAVQMSFAQINIIGETSKENILNTEHKEWFINTYDEFEPNEKTISTLKSLFKKNDFHIDIYFGTWCEDSQREVPKVFKLLELSNFNFKNMKIIALDEDKIVPNTTKEELKEINIINVPTIIVYHKGKEVNRFVEYAQESLEKDLVKIFTNQPYKHSYYN